MQLCFCKFYFISLITLFLLLILPLAIAQDEDELPETCDSPIYCKGNLLRIVQLSGIFADCKTFVDFKIKYDIKTTIMNFEEFMRDRDDKPTLQEVKLFIEKYFEQDNEFEDAELLDFNPLKILLYI